MKKWITLTGLGLVALVICLLSAREIHAQRGCPVDRPCIVDYSYEGNSLRVHWDGHQNYSHYNFTWSRPGRESSQFETRGGGGGSFRINNIHLGTTYSFSVQGCNRSLLGRSSCTPWYTETYTPNRR